MAREARLRRTWAGLIDATPDAIPALGEASAVPAFLFATGFNDQGLALDPVAGKWTTPALPQAASGNPRAWCRHHAPGAVTPQSTGGTPARGPVTQSVRLRAGTPAEMAEQRQA